MVEFLCMNGRAVAMLVVVLSGLRWCSCTSARAFARPVYVSRPIVPWRLALFAMSAGAQCVRCVLC
eukprot:6892935-Lingulodinium_polyedra.AAC.1